MLNPCRSLTYIGTYALETLRSELAQQHIVLGIVRASSRIRRILDRAEVTKVIGAENFHYTIRAGIKKFQENGDHANGYL